MNDRPTDKNISFRSRIWMTADEQKAARPFEEAGFEDTGEVLRLRVYDMLNILGIDRIMAEEMLYALYRFFNDNSEADEALRDHVIDQYFDFAAWHREHPDMAEVKVEDLALAEGINLRALAFLFNQAAKKFWKSGEYSSREYRYFSYHDLLEQAGGKR